MNRSIRARGLLVTTLLVAMVGCVRTPDINVDASGWRSERVDTTRIPETRNHEDAKAELRKAHREIERLRRENDKLKRKYEDEKRKREDLKRKYDD